MGEWSPCTHWSSSEIDCLLSWHFSYFLSNIARVLAILITGLALALWFISYQEHPPPSSPLLSPYWEACPSYSPALLQLRPPVAPIFSVAPLSIAPLSSHGLFSCVLRTVCSVTWNLALGSTWGVPPPRAPVPGDSGLGDSPVFLSVIKSVVAKLNCIFMRFYCIWGHLKNPFYGNYF